MLQLINCSSVLNLMQFLHLLFVFLQLNMRTESPSIKGIFNSSLGDCIISEPLEGLVLIILILYSRSPLIDVISVWILRRGLDSVNKVGFELVSTHVGLALLRHYLGSVQIPSKGHGGVEGKWRRLRGGGSE